MVRQVGRSKRSQRRILVATCFGVVAVLASGMIAANAAETVGPVAKKGRIVSGVVSAPKPAAASPNANTTTAKPASGTPFAQFGGKCDGVTDDRAALEAAAKAAVPVVIPAAQCRVSTGAMITLGDKATLVGASKGATLLMDSGGAYSSIFNVSGTGVSLTNLNVVRNSNGPGVAIFLAGAQNFTMDGVVIDGKKAAFTGEYFHGIAIGGEAGMTNSNIKFINGSIRDTDYGLFQDSGVKSVTDGFVVDNSTFTNNYMDDLEFNAPESKMVNISVTNSKFSDNKAANSAVPYGFGVGLANVQYATIQNNTFTNYPYLPVHIEDRSAFVKVDGNKFSNSFTESINYASHVFIVSGAHDIDVTNNDFDLSANTNSVVAVYVGDGGSGKAPSNVTISGNSFVLGPNASPLGDYGGINTKMGQNTGG